jgi:hypothetical protein
MMQGCGFDNICVSEGLDHANNERPKQLAKKDQRAE